MNGERGAARADGVPDLSGLPAGFVWGAATSAVQVEGVGEGRGQSIWDTFCNEAGRIRDGSDPTVAADHVTRYAEDVVLLRDLGVDAYRCSIAWSRVQPHGKGPLQAKGMAFYDRLIDEVLGVGIEPWVSLYHWDLPQQLQNTGGWPVRETVERFVDYAVSVHAALGDRVRRWTTIEDPWSVAWLGYGQGVHAPGGSDTTLAVRAAHHLLVAHGQALTAMRAQAPADHAFGIVLNPGRYRAADALGEADVAAVQPGIRVLDGVRARWWLDALLLGSYPDDLVELLAEHLRGVVQPGDLESIAQPLDFLGVSYFGDTLVQPRTRNDEAAGPDLPGTEAISLAAPASERSAGGRPITPDGLREVLVRIGRHWPPVPLVVAANGAAFPDSRASLAVREGDDRAPIADPARVEYLHEHLGALAAAVAEGADVFGYFLWSLLDGFDWAHGLSRRYGVVRVDFESGERRVRASYQAYRNLVEAQHAAHGALAGRS